MLFLHSLSSNSVSPIDPAPQLLPLLAPPRPSSRTTNGTKSRADSVSPTANLPLINFPGGVKPRSRAEVLREYRAKVGRPYLPEDLLLRDVLYLLQGISGKYVRFDSNKSKSEQYVVFAEDGVSIAVETVGSECLMFSRHLFTGVHHSGPYTYFNTSACGTGVSIHSGIRVCSIKGGEAHSWANRTGLFVDPFFCWFLIKLILESLPSLAATTNRILPTAGSVGSPSQCTRLKPRVNPRQWSFVTTFGSVD